MQADENNNGKNKGLAKRLVITVVAVILYVAVRALWGLVEGPTTGALTAQQLNDSVSSYAAAKAVRDGIVPWVTTLVLIATMAITWIPFVFRALTSSADESND